MRKKDKKPKGDTAPNVQVRFEIHMDAFIDFGLYKLINNPKVCGLRIEEIKETTQ
jgi:hypothetical protein